VASSKQQPSSQPNRSRDTEKSPSELRPESLPSARLMRGIRGVLRLAGADAPASLRMTIKEKGRRHATTAPLLVPEFSTGTRILLGWRVSRLAAAECRG